MGHTYTDLLVHVVFSTAGREPLVRDEFRTRLNEYMAGIARQEFGLALQIGGIADHVHGLLAIKPSIAVATAMRDWKALSSKWVNEVIRPQGKFHWQTGYAAFSVSRSQVEAVRNYIAHQQEHHRAMTFQDEVLRMLEKHGIEYDARYLWD